MAPFVFKNLEIFKVMLAGIISCGLLVSLFCFFIFESLTALALNLLMLFFWAALYLLLVVKVEFLAISFLIIYVGAIAILIIFGLMVLGVSVRTVQRTKSILFYVGFLNACLLLAKTHSLSTATLFSHQLLSSNILGSFSQAHVGGLWLQDISILGLNLYKTQFTYFWVCGLLLLVAIFGVIAMTTPTREGWRRPFTGFSS